MKHLYLDVILAGFGGQGILLIGNLLAYAAMNSGLNTSYIPVYGPEMRGGTANCTVVISDEDICSPLVKHPKALIAMNQPSLEKFMPRLESGGMQIINSSLINIQDFRKDIKTICVPANGLAEKINSPKLANMVILGAFIKATQILPLTEVKKSLNDVISSHYMHLKTKNEEALELGFDFVQD
ncbi:2-oxoacid:acceptor oxidoreductase family protein [Desulfovibrio litoralis]|uniref:2-oxoglutarate ferredoxin oxidoreductase, gamma subunit n=1 Tax=Desulfovibrio litoralis DSM 11393 TaxID=1121455 RepID=A0A1M7SF40_9BACT|nr:2-oxoacid:acceptor oxidoreductase family protein [Desulfovibrio litoralis]SHN57083.1 2-oxoglutarate ferredoxin oxidoreductase, gamma subunit [Desulfovibrio litoralis DSM 11393]